MLALLLATGPLATACEMVFDFDRTPLQPIYEAGTEEEPGADGSPTTPGDSGGRDSNTTPDAPHEAGPEDAGADVEQDT